MSLSSQRGFRSPNPGLSRHHQVHMTPGSHVALGQGEGKEPCPIPASLLPHVCVAGASYVLPLAEYMRM